MIIAQTSGRTGKGGGGYLGGTPRSISSHQPAHTECRFARRWARVAQKCPTTAHAQRKQPQWRRLAVGTSVTITSSGLPLRPSATLKSAGGGAGSSESLRASTAARWLSLSGSSLSSRRAHVCRLAGRKQARCQARVAAGTAAGLL